MSLTYYCKDILYFEICLLRISNVDFIQLFRQNEKKILGNYDKCGLLGNSTIEHSSTRS